MLVLGIETSCDETAFGLVENGKLLTESVASQADVHSLFGGVVPELASREHYRILGPLFDNFISRAGMTLDQLDGIAVARGPGLLGSLLVGLAFAKGLAFGANLPLIGVDHLRAHLLAPGLENEISFPAMGLLVSGGHTHIYYMEDPYYFELLGRTLDDAAGEAFDKVAKMLGLPYPGGRFLDRLAVEGSADTHLFTYPYMDNDNLDFSFSGLKTAAAFYLAQHPEVRNMAMSLPSNFPEFMKIDNFDDLAVLADFCASFNHCVSHTLCLKVRRAFKQLNYAGKQIRSLLVAGGVAANTMLRQEACRLAKDLGLMLVLPKFSLCTDNGAMIAYAGYLLLKEGYCHSLDLQAIPRGQIIPDDYMTM